MGQNRLRSPSSSLIQAFRSYKPSILHSQKTASTASGWSLFPPRPPLNLLSFFSGSLGDYSSWISTRQKRPKSTLRFTASQSGQKFAETVLELTKLRKF